MSGDPWVVIGNPENRRVTLFQEALAELGHPILAVVPWAALLEDPGVLDEVPDVPAYVRIESPGENAQVQRQLLARGGCPEVVPEHGELVAPSAQHRGLIDALFEIEGIAATHPQWTLTARADAIAGLFDKRRFHQAAHAVGIRVAPALDVDSVSGLEAALREVEQPLFVKLRTGSSASGIGVLLPGPPMRLMTTMRRREGRWFNSLRVNRIDDPERIRRVLRYLLEEEGAHVELAVPKARLDGARFDVRVVCVAGEPAFAVVRQARHPITNLHLGGWRGRLDALTEACPGQVWAAALEDCRHVAARYGGLHVGIDVLVERGFRAHRILEANAFGDLLPGLVRGSHSVYQVEVLAADRWRRKLRLG